MKTFSIKTFGCKVNQYESQAIREKLLAGGYAEDYGESSPDLHIVNTCCVTDRAEKKSGQYIRRLMREFPNSKLIVTGCGVKYKPESFRGSISSEIAIGDGWGRGISGFSGHTRAFVKIQDGCNQFCSYCVLPYIRGRSTCRDIEEILAEVKQLVSNGYREIVLTGIHLGDYNKLPELLKLLCGLPDLLRIRLSSLEPQDITDNILETVSESAKICRHFHIPLQSGSSKILNLMNRRYTYPEYKKIIENIRSKISDVNFTTDIMAGFPGENEKDFLETVDAVKESGFVKVHIFPYSHRAGTVAAGFLERVPQEEIKKRVSVLKETADKVAYEMKKGLVGSLQEVLVEGDEREINGYTSGYIPVRIRGRAGKNSLVKVKIAGINGQNLIGEICI